MGCPHCHGLPRLVRSEPSHFWEQAFWPATAYPRHQARCFSCHLLPLSGWRCGHTIGHVKMPIVNWGVSATVHCVSLRALPRPTMTTPRLACHAMADEPPVTGSGHTWLGHAVLLWRGQVSTLAHWVLARLRLQRHEDWVLFFPIGFVLKGGLPVGF